MGAMTDRLSAPISVDDVRRAIAVVLMKLRVDGTPDDEVVDVLRLHFPEEQAAALVPRVMTVLMWLLSDQADGLVEDGPLGLPRIHPAVFEVVAAAPMRDGVPMRPDRFFRDLARRLRTYDAVITSSSSV